MTLIEIEALPNEILTPAQAASALSMNQDTLRQTAFACPERLGFPVIVTGRYVRIPKQAFLRFMRGELQ